MKILEDEMVNEITSKICEKMYLLYIEEIISLMNSNLIKDSKYSFFICQTILSTFFLVTLSNNCKMASASPKEIFNLLEINEKIDEMEKNFLEKKDD